MPNTNNNMNSQPVCGNTLYTKSSMSSVTSISLTTNTVTFTSAITPIIKSSYLPYYESNNTAVIDLTYIDDAVIKTKSGDINLNELALVLSEIKDILCIAKASTDKINDYETLKAAFDQYKMVENIVKNG